MFELKPTLGGWKEKVLHTFTNNGVDGIYPPDGVAIDGAGNLYGTTSGGGSSTLCGGQGCGTVFKMTPGPNGNWTETILYSFTNLNGDGNGPYGGLTLDARGNLYGTTSGGGLYNGGTVFELTPQAGRWTETILHQFSGTGGDSSDGNYPSASLIFDPSGNLYGTTVEGGIHGGGTVFEIRP